MEFADVLAALETAGAPYVVVGSMAAALAGAACEPNDLDVVVAPWAGQLVLHTLLRSGFCPTLPLALHEVSVMRFLDAKGREVDLFMRFAIPFDELWANSRRVEYAGGSACVASAEDLVRARERTGR